ncbi:MAG: hypothetical protein JWL83_3300 [Actinomycetia bacterium]|nr:hypothetical protein [Actinomycetes bacterium]
MAPRWHLSPSPAHHRAARGVLTLCIVFVATACSPLWTMYNRDLAHTGSDTSAPDVVPVASAWSTQVDGATQGQPLVYNNRVYVATENDTIYAFDFKSGAIVWKTNLGVPVRAATVPCPLNLDPVGITGTPVIDSNTNTIFAVAVLAGPVRHEFFGLDLDTGAVRVDVSGDPPGVDPQMDHQRPALAINNGRVYWGYGGADCGFYHGKVLSMKTDGTSPLVYTVPSVNYGSLWGTSGPAIDPDGNVWVATGDGTSRTTPDKTTSLIKLSPTLDELGYFTPSNWSDLNTTGSELGSAGPLILPNGYVFAMGKNRVAYIVKQSAPGGIGGQVASLDLGCRAFGGAAWTPGMVYVACEDGTRAISVTGLDTATPTMSAVWRGPSDARGPAVVGSNTVWVMAPVTGVLYALNPTDGTVRQSLTIGHAGNFTAPTIANDTILVATDARVQAFRHPG